MSRQTEVNRSYLTASSTPWASPLPHFRYPLIDVSKMAKDWDVPKEKCKGGVGLLVSSSLEQFVANLFRDGSRV